jgi:hypothetical protein
MGNNVLERLGAILRPGVMAAGLAGMLASPVLAAAPASPAPLSGGAVVKLPGVPTASAPAWSGDISWVDGNGTYYLADRTLKGIDVVDPNSKYVSTITGGFAGVKLTKKGAVDNDHSGPNGLLVIDSRHEAWAGDGDSTIKVVDLLAGQVVASIPNGGKARADELAYDSADGIILIANDADDPPFITFLSVANRSILGTLAYPDATNGIEQSVYDSANGKFYLAVPQTKQNPGGQIDVIDPKAMAVVASYPVSNCIPHGLALGPSQQLLLGCSSDAINLLGAPAQSQIMDAATGSIVAVVKGIGGSDEVWYNSGDNRYYLAASGMTSDGTKNGKPAPVVGVIDASSNQYVGGMPTGAGAHSVAADARSGRVFSPIPSKGLTVFTSPGLRRGNTVTGVLNGQLNGTFNTYRFIGDGDPVSATFTYDRSAGTDGGMSVKIFGPNGMAVTARGAAPGKAITAPQQTIAITNPTLAQGSAEAFANTQDGVEYQIQVSNYNPGFNANYTLAIQ